jgi:hypothetical protein
MMGVGIDAQDAAPHICTRACVCGARACAVALALVGTLLAASELRAVLELRCTAHTNCNCTYTYYLYCTTRLLLNLMKNGGLSCP